MSTSPGVIDNLISIEQSWKFLLENWIIINSFSSLHAKPVGIINQHPFSNYKYNIYIYIIYIYVTRKAKTDLMALAIFDQRSVFNSLLRSYL